MKRTDKISTIKGVGPKSEALFQKVGIETVDDLLHYYPRSYITYPDPSTTQDLNEGYHITLDVCLKSGLVVRSFGKKSFASGKFADLFGEVKAVWFNMPYIRQLIKPGARVILRGRVRRNGKNLELEQPEIFTPEAYQAKQKTLQPVYSLTAGLKNGLLVKSLRGCLAEQELWDTLPETMPEALRVKYDLLSSSDAIRDIHFPVDEPSFFQARKRLVFEEFLLFLLSLKKAGGTEQTSLNSFCLERSSYVQKYRESLPFSLTNAQEEAWRDIKRDLDSEHVMNRLIQGDVGSGKTVIAVMTLLLAAENGYQGALMAPTEVLARQHYESITEEMQKAGIPVHITLLTGSLSAAAKRKAREEIESGEADLIIGTHALIQDMVKFHNLAIAITDEQHRFGVDQRKTLQKKGIYPHVLVMSATPIPRTLALILYGDLSVSMVRELPKNRLPIKNAAVDTGYRNTAYQFILSQIRDGHQAYIICPLVEPSEEIDGEDVTTYTEKIRSIFPEEIKIGTLHGRMKQDEKNAVMEAFASGDTDILVSTTVVEVGVNVPNATVMMVENAESFGLSTLHQLRGRVGRGASQSYCIFVAGKKGKDSKKRLEILTKTNDGFEVAEMDLSMRGPGEVLGSRQSGELGFRIGDIIADSSVLKEASDAAEQILAGELPLSGEEEEALGFALQAYSPETMVL